MKRLFTILIFLFALAAAKAEFIAPDGESLSYRVMYKWGLINQQAGTVTLTTHKADKRRIKARLTASSAPWADKFYRLRDTLNGYILAASYEPLSYEKISHERSEYKRDYITYTRAGNNVKGHCQRFRQKNKKSPITTSEIELESEGLTMDMLSAYYYMRALDYQSMAPGQQTVLTVFSGKRKETLTITYKGTETVNIDNTEYPSFLISFTFTGKSGKKTSDDMFAWISSSADRIPLKLEGRLPVGKVQCYYVRPTASGK